MSDVSAIIEAMREVERKGLNSGTSGNISVRRGAGMLITPTGITPDKLEPEMVVEMDLDGSWQGRFKPSSEWAMHAAIYRVYPHAHAIVHAHPDACVALSCMRRPIPAFHYMIASFGGVDLPCSRYAPFGSPAIAETAVEALRDRTACLLANHGMICHASSLAQATASVVKLETLARQYLLVRSIGNPVLLNDNEIAEVLDRYKIYGQQ